jgi:hypothetical protein
VGGKVNDCLSSGIFDGAVRGDTIAEIPFDEFRTRIDGGAVTFAQIIQHRDRMSGLDQLRNANGADIARSPCDQHIHRARV